MSLLYRIKNFMQIVSSISLLLFSLNSFANDDSDNDGIPDLQDNCLTIANPDQFDSDSDDYGNLCDGDLNNDGNTNTLDLNLYKLAHRTSRGDTTYNSHADFNSDGRINTLDLNIYKTLHRKPPGPSGIKTSILSLVTTWQIQLQGTINTDYAADLYDIDLFDSPVTLINTLKASEKLVICYFSAGSYEEWRDDASQYNESDKGLPLDGWPGERWLDIRSDNVKNIIETRLDLAKQKGCDGVDPDNVDGYTNQTGFNLTALDQLSFNRFLAKAAHQRGLLVGLKNDLDQVSELVNNFDFSVNEQCYEFNECMLLAPFIDSGKPVFNIEYNDRYINNPTDQSTLCQQALEKLFQTLLLPLALDDSFRISCSL